MKIDENRKNFWRAFIRNIHSEILNKFKDGPKPFQNVNNKVIDNIVSTLVVYLNTYLLPVTVDYINQERSKNNISKDDSIYRKIFSGDFEKTMEIFEKNYSLVMQGIYDYCGLFKTHFMQTCDRIFSDWDEIKTEFHIEDTDLIDYIRLFCGDPHGQGAQTSIITFNNGKKGFVYKPVNLSVVKFFHEIVYFSKNTLNFSFKKIPKTILKKGIGIGDYGYINFIPYNGDVKNIDEAKEVYRNFGKILAFARYFKVADGHSDNIIISSPDVFWVDLENAFHFDFSEFPLDIHPLEITGLIADAKPETTVFGLITGIQGGTIPRLNLTQPIVYNDGTDDMYIRYFGVTDVPIEEKKNRIYLNGEMLKPDDFIENVKQGYKETLEKLILNKDKILAYIESYFQKNKVIVRHIVKATACYGRYINLLKHPVGIRNGDVLSHVRKELEQITQEEAPIKHFIVENEIIDVCNGVVPYFYRSSENYNLYHISGAYYANYFKKSIYEEFIDHIDKLDLNIIEEDIIFVEKALHSTSNIKSWDEFKDKFDYPMFNYNERLLEINNQT